MPRVLVVGAGHAGLEAALAAARIGVAVSVVTGTRSTIGQTPCNPAIGGVAKGHLVHEIHALGGFMGEAADRSGIHGRVLNRSKGPAVWSTRIQVDKRRYGEFASARLLGAPGITTVEGLVVALVERPDAIGVRLGDGRELWADAIVLTTGTFLGGLLHTGSERRPGGRIGEAPASELAEDLRARGLRLARLKTGTPPRLDPRTIAWDRLEPQPSDEPFPTFVPPDDPSAGAGPGRVHCHITYTNPQTHAIIRERLAESPMYSGQIVGVGPRYCPSIEDKVVRFAERERHQIFLEPEGLDEDALVYPNGISTSLAAEVQEAFVHSIAGLEQARIVRPGYAVEYDAVDARSLTHGLASKDCPRLFFAGQINGTSGYEEAAIQGLLAGANAALAVLDRPPLVLGRDQAYGGVLVDDLVTQGCDEPYRMFTSRAEYRLLLREDNADERLSAIAHANGLIDDERFTLVQRRLERVERCIEGHEGEDDRFSEWIRAKARARTLYAGYLDRQRREVERIRGDAGDLPLALDLDYFSLAGLSRESATRLAQVRPSSTSQAARIPGMTPAALACLWAHARAWHRVRA